MHLLVHQRQPLLSVVAAFMQVVARRSIVKAAARSFGAAQLPSRLLLNGGSSGCQRAACTPHLQPHTTIALVMQRQQQQRPCAMASRCTGQQVQGLAFITWCQQQQQMHSKQCQSTADCVMCGWPSLHPRQPSTTSSLAACNHTQPSSSRAYSASSLHQNSGSSSNGSCNISYQLDAIHSVPASAAQTGNRSSSPSSKPVVAVAMSGGVDSAVSALLLKRLGYQIIGVYMHNWDNADEVGSGTPVCTSEADLTDAKAVCAQLNIPLYEANFVSTYWNKVFEHFLEGLALGLTPNPDLACNSHIKFGALLDFAQQKGADLLATGHYARVGWQQQPAAIGSLHHIISSSRSTNNGRKTIQSSSISSRSDGINDIHRPPACLLLKGSDPLKDQSYFLAGLNHQQLACVMFPVGHLSKAEVRQIAAASGLPMATKRSSAGICFIGRRSFGRFLEDYIQPKPGAYIDVDSGKTLGPCANMLALTVGQKALGLGGQKARGYVVGKRVTDGVVYVAYGHDHPALSSSKVLLCQPNWVAGMEPSVLPPSGAAAEAVLHCEYKARYRQPLGQCVVRAVSSGQQQQFVSSQYCSSSVLGHISTDGIHAIQEPRHSTVFPAAATPGSPQPLGTATMLLNTHSPATGAVGQAYVADLSHPLRGVTPGQVFVMYDGEICLGSAVIAAHGPTLHERAGLW
eukprot:GHRR01003659.1.p1 GENE.GHRR01003659.1~~GHRR01003659.1.p1  ORF type:complete len:686 (+),score=221.38 GHRR01003659.1:902-2959(+)